MACGNIARIVTPGTGQNACTIARFTRAQALFEKVPLAPLPPRCVYGGPKKLFSIFSEIG